MRTRPSVSPKLGCNHAGNTTRKPHDPDTHCRCHVAKTTHIQGRRVPTSTRPTCSCFAAKYDWRASLMWWSPNSTPAVSKPCRSLVSRRMLPIFSRSALPTTSHARRRVAALALRSQSQSRVTVTITAKKGHGGNCKQCCDRTPSITGIVLHGPCSITTPPRPGFAATTDSSAHGRLSIKSASRAHKCGTHKWDTHVAVVVSVDCSERNSGARFQR